MGRTSKVAMGLAFLIAACSEEKVVPDDQPTTGVIVGKVSNVSGGLIANASITSGARTTTTNEQGFFTLEEVPAGQRIAMQIRADGYAGSTEVVVAQPGRSTFVRIALLPYAGQQTFSAASGGTVNGSGAQVSFAAGAIPGSQTVTARLAVLRANADEELAAFPGDFSTNAGDMLETFGAIAIEVTDSTGQKLNLASGASATVQMPVPAGSPDTIPLWSFDEASGVWKQEGTLTGCSDGTCSGTIGHLSWWNADQVLETTCVTVCVVDADGAPAVGISVDGSGVDYNGSSAAFTGSDGCACLEVKRGASVDVVGISSGGVTTPVRVTTSAAAAQCGDAACQRLNAPLVVSPPKFQAILTWGQAPSDLDTHLTGPCDPASPGCTPGGRFHVYYSTQGSLSEAPWAYLDTDDTTSFGPEVATLAKTFTGVYRYSVHNFSGSPDMATSQARVFVLLPDGSTQSLTVPTQNPGELDYWIVGELDCTGPANAAATACTWRTINTFGTEADRKTSGS